MGNVRCAGLYAVIKPGDMAQLGTGGIILDLAGIVGALFKVTSSELRKITVHTVCRG